MRKRWSDVRPGDRVVVTVGEGVDNTYRDHGKMYIDFVGIEADFSDGRLVDPDAEVEVVEGPDAEQREGQWHAALNAACTCGAGEKIASGLLGTEGTCGACNVWNVMCGRGIRKAAEEGE